MVRALLLAAILTATGFAADMKPGEVLPWCRVTLNMASSVDIDPPVYKTIDGWYDAESLMLLTPACFDGKNPFTPGPLDPATVVKVVPGAFSPSPMPEAARKIVSNARAKAAARADEKAKAKVDR